MLALLRGTGRAAAQVPVRGLGAARRALAVEQGALQTDDPAAAKQPFVEEDNTSDRRRIKEAYEEIKAGRSGTAEDVGIKDAQPTSLGKMTSAADPTQVEKEYLAGMAEDVPTSRELEKDSEDVAEEVFAGRELDRERGTKSTETPPGTAGPPK